MVMFNGLFRPPTVRMSIYDTKVNIYDIRVSLCKFRAGHFNYTVSINDVTVGLLVSKVSYIQDRKNS